nr:hypothetical protein 46 [bacterium]
MAKSGTRIQVFFNTSIAEEIEAISKAEGVSLSRVVGDCVDCYRQTDEYRSRLKDAFGRLNRVKTEVLEALGPDLSEDKLRAVLKALDKID